MNGDDNTTPALVAFLVYCFICFVSTFMLITGSSYFDSVSNIILIIIDSFSIFAISYFIISFIRKL